MLNFHRRHNHHHCRCRRIFTSTSAEGTLVSGWHRSMGRSKLHRQYYDQKRVGSYGGVAALQRVVPAERDVERWLSMQDAYTLHKPVTRRFKRRCVVVGGPILPLGGSTVVQVGRWRHHTIPFNYTLENCHLTPDHERCRMRFC